MTDVLTTWAVVIYRGIDTIISDDNSSLDSEDDYPYENNYIFSLFYIYFKAIMPIFSLFYVANTLF